MFMSECMTTFVAVSGVTARVCAYVSLCLITSEECVLAGSVSACSVRLCEPMSVRVGAIAPVLGCLCNCLNWSMGVDLTLGGVSV